MLRFCIDKKSSKTKGVKSLKNNTRCVTKKVFFGGCCQIMSLILHHFVAWCWVEWCCVRMEEKIFANKQQREALLNLTCIQWFKILCADAQKDSQFFSYISLIKWLWWICTDRGNIYADGCLVGGWSKFSNNVEILKPAASGRQLGCWLGFFWPGFKSQLASQWAKMFSRWL